jgi:hypothetical protein
MTMGEKMRAKKAAQKAAAESTDRKKMPVSPQQQRVTVTLASARLFVLTPHSSFTSIGVTLRITFLR